ncbi:MAG: class I SAM-dependent methyltransferase [Holosporales bacterium]|nr:class I SAM-dependent methyltransferase [Holosporales bacterium]
MTKDKNINTFVVKDFGDEWRTFNQESLTGNALLAAADEYFHLFPFDRLKYATGFDMGCGSGRWAKVVAPQVHSLTCIDPSSIALEQARRNLKGVPNCTFECASVEGTSLKDNSQDFGYCLGVLHHVPDTASGLKECVKKLKEEGVFLLYLYYRFDNKPTWFRFIWKVSDWGRRGISKLPFRLKLCISQIGAAFVYWPLARTSLLLEKFGMNVLNIPLSNYRNKSFYFMRTDALDRFGTKLEHRFTKEEIRKMMIDAGLKDIRFSTRPPFWVALGIKATR